MQKYSCVELRTIGQVFQVTPPLDVLARCAGLKILNISRSRCATPTEHKKTRRKKRGGRRKRHVIDVILSANLGHFLTRDLAHECVAHNRNVNINNACVANNRNVNINNLVYIDCSNDFRERTPHFRIGCINTQSCCNKTEMTSDQLIEQDIDILCITETWLHEQGDDHILAMLRPPGYEIKSFPRIDQRGGGVAFIYRLSSFTIRTSEWSLTCYKTFEIATCSFQTSHHNKLTIVCIYRPSSRELQKTSTNGEETFFTEFNDLVCSLRQRGHPFVITGDLNIHVDIPTDLFTVLIQSILDQHELVQHVTVPTHNNGHTLDLIITTKEHSFLVDLEVIDKSISDHFLLRADIDTLKLKKLQHTVQSRDIKRLDKAAFLSDAASSLSSSTISAECLVSTLRDTLDKHAPVVTRTISVRPVAPWYTLDIKEAKRKRRQTERRWRKSGLQVHRDILAHQRNIINSLIRSHKKAYFTKKLEEVKTTKELFQTTDHLMGHQTSSSFPPGEDKELCNQFLLTFNNKIDNIRTFLGNHTPLPDEHEPSTGNTMTEFCYVTEEEITKYIKASSPKTCDLDPIPTSLLKEYTMELVPYITKIINESLATGVVPDIFKRAIVTPLLKKPGLDETDLKNFRPVSNLNFL